MSSRSRGGGLSPRRRLVIVAASAAATLAAVVVLFLVWAVWSYQGPGPSAKSGDTTLVMLRKGAGVSEIAATLFMAEGTVKTHIGRLLAKLQCRDRVGLVLFAFETGLAR